MARTRKLTARAAIIKVLSDAGGKMSVPDIIKAAVPLTALTGKTPGQTIYSTLYAENKKPGGIFKRVDRGQFKLDKTALAKAEKAATDKAAAKAEKPKAAPRKRAAKDDEQTLAEAAEQDGDAPQVAEVEQVKEGATA